jgi:hypothetical protein
MQKISGHCPFKVFFMNWFFPPPSIPLEQFRIFSKIHGDICCSRCTTSVVDTGGVLHGYVQNFYRTPAGYTADRKTRRKRNMGCYGLLSASCHPSPPPSTFPPPHTAHLSHHLRPRYQDWLAEGDPPLSHIPPPPNRIIARSWQPGSKSRTASI